MTISLIFSRPISPAYAWLAAKRERSSGIVQGNRSVAGGEPELDWLAK